MAVTGKTGADSVFKSIQAIARVVKSYNLKLRGVAAVMLGLGALTSVEYAAAIAFLDSISTAIIVFEKIAQYSGF